LKRGRNFIGKVKRLHWKGEETSTCPLNGILNKHVLGPIHTIKDLSSVLILMIDD